MLGQLHIKNIGIIEDVVINFEDGFNVLTGETGAGKSLIIGSIGAVTGSRISKELIKTGKDSALIEACFFEGEDTFLRPLRGQPQLSTAKTSSASILPIVS